MPRQLKLLPESDAPLLRSTLIVARAAIPENLTDSEKRVLRTHFDMNCGQSFFFWDCADLQRVLRRARQSHPANTLQTGGRS